MLSRHTLVRSLAEFVVVVLAVALGLAGDNWRQDLVDRRTEAEYVNRLLRDVSESQDVLETLRDRYAAAREGAQRLAEALAKTSPSAGDNQLIEDLLAASRIYTSQSSVSSNVTYQELVASGRLSLLRDSQVREAVVGYYRALERLDEWASSFQPLNQRVARLTGYFPSEFILGRQELTTEDRNRLLQEILGRPQLVEDLRQVHAQLAFAIDGLLDPIVARGEELGKLLGATGGSV